MYVNVNNPGIPVSFGDFAFPCHRITKIVKMACGVRVYSDETWHENRFMSLEEAVKLWKDAIKESAK